MPVCILASLLLLDNLSLLGAIFVSCSIGVMLITLPLFVCGCVSAFYDGYIIYQFGWAQYCEGWATWWKSKSADTTFPFYHASRAPVVFLIRNLNSSFWLYAIFVIGLSLQYVMPVYGPLMLIGSIVCIIAGMMNVSKARLQAWHDSQYFGLILLSVWLHPTNTDLTFCGITILRGRLSVLADIEIDILSFPLRLEQARIQQRVLKRNNHRGEENIARSCHFFTRYVLDGGDSSVRQTRLDRTFEGQAFKAFRADLWNNPNYCFDSRFTDLSHPYLAINGQAEYRTAISVQLAKFEQSSFFEPRLQDAQDDDPVRLNLYWLLGNRLQGPQRSKNEWTRRSARAEDLMSHADADELSGIFGGS